MLGIEQELAMSKASESLWPHHKFSMKIWTPEYKYYYESNPELANKD